MNCKSAYIYNVLKQVHPNKCITKDAMDFCNKILDVIFYSLIICYQKHGNLVKSIELLLSGELFIYSSSESLKACDKFSANTKCYKKVEDVLSSNIARSTQASLTFNVIIIEEMLKKLGCELLSDYFLIYLTATLEYLTAEIMELSGSIAGSKHKLITVNHIIGAINKDDELSNTIKNVVSTCDIEWSMYIKSLDMDRILNKTIFDPKTPCILGNFKNKKAVYGKKKVTYVEIDKSFPEIVSCFSIYFEADILFGEVANNSYNLRYKDDLEHIAQQKIEEDEEMDDNIEESENDESDQDYDNLEEEEEYFTFSVSELKEHDRKVIEAYLKEKEKSVETKRKRKYPTLEDVEEPGFDN